MKTLAIARITLLELWRQRTPWGFFAVAALMALPAFAPADLLHMNGGNQVGFAFLGGLLGFAQFVALFLALSIASGLVANDLERGTHLLVVTKPLARYHMLLGKLLGAGVFMLGAWLAWGGIASLALSIRFGLGIVPPTMLAFLVSSLTSWLLVAYCIFWSSFMPANATMGIAVLGWILTTSVPKLAPVAESLGHPEMAKVLGAVGWVLPVDKLSDLAKSLVDGSVANLQNYWAIALIAAWWLLAVVILTRRDLASQG